MTGGIKHGTRRSKLNDEQLAEIRALYQSGFSTHAIGERFGVSHTTVRTALLAHDVELRGKGWRKNQVDITAELYVSGMTITAIGERLSLDKSTVWHRLKAAGVMIRSKRGARKPAPKRSTHTGAAYHSNCRCDHCRKGKAAYWAARQAAVKAGVAEVGRHGTGGYRQGCRCETCTAAVREKARESRKR